MKRGEVWIVSGGGFAGKPRPAVIIQSDAFEFSPSVTVCPFTSDDTEASYVRVPFSPSETNGLRLQSVLMTDKITTVHKSQFGQRAGRLQEDEMAKVEEAILLFLGLGR